MSHSEGNFKKSLPSWRCKALMHGCVCCSMIPQQVIRWSWNIFHQLQTPQFSYIVKMDDSVQLYPLIPLILIHTTDSIQNGKLIECLKGKTIIIMQAILCKVCTNEHSVCIQQRQFLRQFPRLLEYCYSHGRILLYSTKCKVDMIWMIYINIWL